MLLPPLLAGGLNATVSWPLPMMGVPMVGAPDTVAGMTAFDAADASPVPTPFVALTVHVYVLPLVSDPTTIGLDAPDALPAAPPLDDVHDAV
jgi:hypothetical protein